MVNIQYDHFGGPAGFTTTLNPTGAGVGTLIKLDLRPEAFQFQSRVPFYWIALTLVALSLIIVRMIEDSRFGAYLIAVRENEDAASALGVDPTKVKLTAMTVSAAITAAAGCFYAQYFLFIDASIAYGPWISIEALLAPNGPVQLDDGD